MVGARVDNSSHSQCVLEVTPHVPILGVIQARSETFQTRRLVERHTLLSRFLILTSAMTQCSPSLVSPRKVKPIFFRMNPVGVKNGETRISLAAISQTSSAIRPDHVIDFESLIFDASVCLGLFQLARNAVVVLLDIDKFRSELDLASESPEMVSDDTLGPALAEENRVQLKTIGELV